MTDKQTIVSSIAMASNTSDGVSKFNFIAEPDSALQCVICLDVAEDPWQHNECGRLLCKECLDKYGRDKPCPNCRMERPLYFTDNRGKREIKGLQVKCCNVERGCEWEGTVGTLEKHDATCEFALVPCPKQCKNDDEAIKLFTRKYLDIHLKKYCPNRDYKCKYCRERGTYATITQIHDGKCDKKILPCSNAGCGDTMERQQVSEHVRTKCPHTMMSCKYKGIGCGTELKRKDRAAHEQDDKLHLHMALDTVNSQQVAIDFLQATVNSQQDILMGLKNKEPKIFVISDVYKNKKKQKLPSFYIPPHGYHMTVVVSAADICTLFTGVLASIFIIEGKYDAGLKWPFVGKVTFTLLNQLEDKKHQTVVLSIDDAHVGIRNDHHLTVPLYELAHDPANNTQYLKDGTLYLRVEVEVDDHKPWLQC